MTSNSPRKSTKTILSCQGILWAPILGTVNHCDPGTFPEGSRCYWFTLSGYDQSVDPLLVPHLWGSFSYRHPPVKKPWLSENSMGKSSNGFPACHVSWPEGGWTTFETVSAWWSGYGSIPIDTFLVGWTSIYQLFWGSLGTRVLTHPHLGNPTKVWLIPSSLLRLAGRASSGVTWRDDTWLVAGWYI